MDPRIGSLFGSDWPQLSPKHISLWRLEKPAQHRSSLSLSTSKKQSKSHVTLSDNKCRQRISNFGC